MEKIFGVGFSKTGTTSLEAALTLLGYKVCKGHWNNNYSNYLAALYKHQDYAPLCQISQLHRLESYRQQQGIEAQELQDSLQRYGLSYLHQTPCDFWANRGNVKS